MAPLAEGRGDKQTGALGPKALRFWLDTVDFETSSSGYLSQQREQQETVQGTCARCICLLAHFTHSLIRER